MDNNNIVRLLQGALNVRVFSENQYNKQKNYFLTKFEFEIHFHEEQEKFC